MKRALTATDLFSHPSNFFALGFGSGLAPVAPGTVGSLVAIPLFLLMPQANIFFYLGLVIILFGFGVWCCGVTARVLGVHDHPGIVWDEIVGMLIALFAAPKIWTWLVLGFLLFRLFDIWKPWPIGWVDRKVDGGMGIMLDDVIAGVMALMVLQAIQFWVVPVILSVFG